MRPLPLVFLLLSSACTNDPDDAPRGDPIAAECADCLSAVDAGGCGAEERACAEDPGCEAALLCRLQFDCWSRHEAASCVERYDCSEPAADAGALLEAVEACARSVCASACDYGTAP